MNIEILQDSIVLFEYWSESKNQKANKKFALLREDVFHNVGITEDLFDENYVTVNLNKSSFSILKKSIKIT